MAWRLSNSKANVSLPLELDRKGGRIVRKKKYRLMETPGALVRRVHQVALSFFFKHCGDLGLTPAQYSVLAAVNERPGVDQTGVMGLIALDRSNVAIVVSKLVSGGHLKRMVNPEDRRAYTLYITTTGCKLLAQMSKRLELVYDDLLSPLEPREREVLLALLKRISSAHNEASRAPLFDRQ
jgi:DNA-binding MarR family transcriptional regulator